MAEIINNYKNIWEQSKTSMIANADPLFKVPWLNESCNDILRPETHLYKVIENLNKDLVGRLESKLSFEKNNNKRQCILSLLGFPYVNEHFGQVQYETSILNNKLDKETKLMNESKAFLSENVTRVIEKHGYQQKLSSYSQETPLGLFLKEALSVFRAATEKHMREGSKLKTNYNGKQAKDKKLLMKNPTVEVWKIYPDILGQALIEVSKNDPERILPLIKIYREYQYPIPNPIRKLLINQYLFGKERANFANGNSLVDIEAAYKEKFIKTVHQNTDNLQIGRAIKSPAWKQIDNLIIEMYGRIAVLRQHDSDDHQLEAARVLNLIHVYNKSFDSILVLWLFPLLLTFDVVVLDTDHHVIHLAMYLELMTRYCIPSADSIFMIADDVINIWRQWNRSQFSHVIQSLQTKPWINIKDFPLQTLHLELSEANRLASRIKDKSRNDIPKECQEVFTKPEIFIRKWIAEGFAGILNEDALLFTWDQLILNNWKSHIIRDLCLSLLFLVSSRFSTAKNYFGIREVFLSDPGRLFTANIKAAFNHIHNGGSFEDIHAMNKKLKNI